VQLKSISFQFVPENGINCLSIPLMISLIESFTFKNLEPQSIFCQFQLFFCIGFTLNLRSQNRKPDFVGSEFPSYKTAILIAESAEIKNFIKGLTWVVAMKRLKRGIYFSSLSILLSWVCIVGMYNYY